MKQRAYKHLASHNGLTPPKMLPLEYGVQITKTKQKKFNLINQLKKYVLYAMNYTNIKINLL